MKEGVKRHCNNNLHKLFRVLRIFNCIKVMPIVKLIFLGHLKDVVGVGSLEVQISHKIKLGEFLQLALGAHSGLHKLISNDGCVTEEDVLVLINGIDIKVFDNPYIEIYVENSDEIVFVPVTHGGLSN